MRAWLELNWQRKDGSTEREHLEAVERQTGKRIEKLDSVRIPEGADGVWGMFMDLIGRMDWQSIDAYQRVTGKYIGPHELAMLRAMDAEYMRFQRERMKEK